MTLLTRVVIVSTTANLPDESLPPMSSVTQTGVYYGFAQVTPSKDGQSTPLNTQDTLVYPMVMSLGWNPFYKNKQLTAVSRLVDYIIRLRPDVLIPRKFISCMISRKTSTAITCKL